MNTGPIDFSAAAQALEAINGAATHEALCASVSELGRALCLPNYLMVHLRGLEAEASAVMHNLSARDLAAAMRHLSRGDSVDALPRVVALELPGFRCAVRTTAVHGSSSCVLLMGSEAEMATAHTTDILGITTLAVTCAMDALRLPASRDGQLPPREIECLAHAAAGHTAKETARRLALSPRTVEEYLARCQARLGVNSTLAAVVAAGRLGWLTSNHVTAAGEVSPQYEARGTGMKAGKT